MSGRPRLLQPQPAKLLAFLRERAAGDGRVPRIPRAEACGLLDLSDRALAAALTALCTLGVAERDDLPRAPEGMLPALRLEGDDAAAPGQRSGPHLGIEATTHRRLTGETISLARVRWLEARA